MNNVEGTQPVALTTFGGCVSEMEAADLPEGASPANQDCDFVPGAVFTRGGRQSVYSFGGLFAEDLAGFAVSVADPNTTAWASPLNATLNIPGTYASVSLNLGNPTVFSFVQFLDFSALARSVNGNITNTAHNFMYLTVWIGAAFGAAINVSDTKGNVWTPIDTSADGGNNGNANFYAANIAGGANTITVSFSGGGAFLDAVVMEFSGVQLASPLDAHNKTQAAGGVTLTTTLPNDLVIFSSGRCDAQTTAAPWNGRYNRPDTLGGAEQIGQDQIIANAGTIVNTLGATAPGWTGGFAQFAAAFKTQTAAASSSQVLKASNFGFNIPIGEAILGVQIEVFGKQSLSTAPIPDPAGAIITGNLQLADGTVSVTRKIDQLPLTDGQVTLGLPSESWALQLTPALVNNPSFSARIVASSPTLATFSIYAIKLKVFTSPTPGANFNYVKTYEQTSGQIDTLALDANGVLWDENVSTGPGVLNGIYTGILPNTFAKSDTFANVEYIAFSNLINGTDIPRHWDGTNLDRVSQVGPGAPPAVNATSTIFQIVSITQNPAVSPAHENGTPGFRAMLWSAGPGNTSSGNTITVYYQTLPQFASGGPQDPNIVIGQGIRIQGAPLIGGQNPNGNYIVTSTGSGVPPNGNFSHASWYFTVTAATSANGFAFTPNSGMTGTTYQVTIATLTTATPLPNTQVGSQITLAGVGVAAWNASWTVLATPNAGQLSVTSTQLSNNVATYTFTLITGVAPTVGQQVTIVGCLNGPTVGGTSIFNISNGIVASVGANQFSINITAQDVTPAGETANATVNGTKFQFDPGIQFAGTATNPIFGNSGGGTVVVGGAGLGAGVRKAVCMFLTRNGLITPCSTPVIFTTTGGSTALAFTSIPIGPPNVIARIIALTGAGGGNFFWIPQPVIVQSSGQNVTYTSTKISDNTSTQAVLTFTDAVLLAGTAIDVSGNNLFNQMELGSCRGFLTYANRLIAWGEQNKIQNLTNLSFEGGIGTGSGGLTTYPLGWTVDPVNGNGGNLRVSPIFGNSYYVQNLTGGVQALYGMIEQAAFQDAYQVPIVQPALTYSARVTARSPGGAQTGSLVVDLFSPLQNRIFGSFTIALSAMTTNFQIFTGTLLTAALASVPADLLFRVYASNLPNNGDVEVDRVEPFPTLQPTFSTQLRASYANNQEAFDLVTGAFGPAQNQQPANGAFVLFDSLYALKEKSLFSTSDNGVTEPFKWNWREVSKKVGTIGQNSYDVGEGWMVTACRPGAYFFEGGEPVKISQEIQSVWDLINWKAGATIWVRNDEQLKRITIGVPIATPNPFMPEFPVNANPTSPNVILMCSYRELNTGAELAHTGPIRSTFSGRLMSPEPARKWSFWNIACPYADFISRGDNNWTEFFCSGYQNSKIFQLSSSELDDDGQAINSFWVSYGFVKPEMADAKGLGLFRMELDYLTMLLTGKGNALVQVYPESVANPLPFQIGAVPLQAFSQGDVELAVNISGNRFFVRVGSNAIGSAWRCSKVVAALVKDPWSEVRGTQVGSA